MTAAHHRTGVLEPAVTRQGTLLGAAISLATVVAIIGAAVLPLLTPAFVHAALDAAGSASSLGLGRAETRTVSDLAVAELVGGPGTFLIAGPGGEPFFDASERAHLRDARTVLWLALTVAAASAVGIMLALARQPADRRKPVWRAIGRGGAAAAIGAVVLGIASLLAFGALFTLFHQVAFPAGNWAFDPATQRLVQLYPTGFWQLVAGSLGLMVVALGTGTWLAARRMGARVSRPVTEPRP